MKTKVIFSIDCTKDYDKEIYFENNNTKLVEKDFGKYREANEKRDARFGYKFKVNNLNKMHRLILYYPDDKTRYMCILDGVAYDITTGVATGEEYKNTNKLIKLEKYFYPRFKDSSITFMNWAHGEPSAVSSFFIEEIEDHIKVEKIENKRAFGVQYEDPCGAGNAEGAKSRSEWSMRVAEHLNMCKMNSFTYPIVWYHGPYYPSDIEKTHYFESVVADNRQMYVRYTRKPYDWVSELLEELGKYDINFHASLTLMRLESLMKRLDDTTILNARNTNKYQRSTKDWTATYNIDNFESITNIKEEGYEPYNLPNNFKYPYFEDVNGDYTQGPIFNPLHPDVEKAIINLVNEILDKYSGYPNFKGLSFNMWHSTFLWFATLDIGYDDYTISLFEKEIGIKIPVEDDSNRFKERYDYLITNMKSEWINWRCEKIFNLFIKIRDIVKDKRKDMSITITSWLEMVIPSLLGGVDSSSQLYARKNNIELFKEAGLDINLFKNVDGIELDIQLEPNRDRSYNSYLEKYSMPAEFTSMFRDFDFLDKDTISVYSNLGNNGVFVFNSWIEAWGKHIWKKVSSDDPNIKSINKIGNKIADGIISLNSHYEKDNFWWDNQYRVVPVFLGHYNYMEYFAHAIGVFDAKKITSGGLILDRSHNKEFREFAKSYTPLPNKDFDTLYIDPVTIRYYEDVDANYIYLVNREDYDISVDIIFNKDDLKLYDYKNEKEVDVEKEIKIVLFPFELRSFKYPKGIKINDVNIQIKDNVKEEYKNQVDEALELIKLAHINKYNIVGIDKVEVDIKDAFKKCEFAYLRHLLNSYVIKSIREKNI